MRADEDDDGQTSAFRCLDMARYTVAAVMTVLIVAVVVISLKVVLHPESLRLSVVDGTIYSTPQPASKVTLLLNLRAENPSCRTRMYFLNITVYLFDGTTPASTPTPWDDCIIFFVFHNGKAVPPQMAVDWLTSVEANNDTNVMNQTYFELLYTKRAVVEYMTLRVDGSLVTEVSSAFNKTRLQIYYCWPLLVGEANGTNKEVLCMDNLGSK